MNAYAVVIVFCALALLGWRANGRKAARLQALKAELRKQAQEQQRAQKIRDVVITMDEHTVRQRLHEIANKQR